MWLLRHPSLIGRSSNHVTITSVVGGASNHVTVRLVVRSAHAGLESLGPQYRLYYSRVNIKWINTVFGMQLVNKVKLSYKFEGFLDKNPIQFFKIFPRNNIKWKVNKITIFN